MIFAYSETCDICYSYLFWSNKIYPIHQEWGNTVGRGHRAISAFWHLMRGGREDRCRIQRAYRVNLMNQGKRFDSRRARPSLTPEYIRLFSLPLK